MRKPLLILLILLSLPLICGCGSLLKFVTVKSAPIPLEPQSTEELRERIRENIDFAERILSHIYVAGVEAFNESVRQASMGLSMVQAVEGVPANPIEPEVEIVVEEDKEEEVIVAKLVPSKRAGKSMKRLHTLALRHKEELEVYRRELDDLRLEMMGMEETSEISSGWLAWFTGGTGVLLIIGIVALFLIAPQLAFRFLGWIANRVAAGVQIAGEEAFKFLKTQFGEVVEAVDQWLDRDDVTEEEKEKLKDTLRKNMKPETKLRVKELKKK